MTDDGGVGLPCLETARLLLRDYRPEDEPGLWLLYGNPEVCRYKSFASYSDQDRVLPLIRRRAAENRRGGSYHWVLADAATDGAIGVVGLRPGDGDGWLVGYVLREEFWGRGYMTEVLGAVLAFAFGTLGAGSVGASHHPDNAGSSRVLEKSGFRDRGRLPDGGQRAGWRLKRVTRGEWLGPGRGTEGGGPKIRT